MKKLYWEIILAGLFVALATLFLYGKLAPFKLFWDSQAIWSMVLAIGWVVVSLGYFHQGWLVHTGKSADHVSIVLPAAVFVVQCILFIKGIFYDDWSLIAGAVMVNSGVTFSLYQIIKAKYSQKKEKNEKKASIRI
jgi:hypothetical protein